MAWTIPDKGEGQNDIQSILFQEYLEILVAGISGLDCVLSGGAVSAQGSPDMTVAVAKAGVLTNGVLKAVAAANATITTADATNPRIDLVVIDSTGAIAVRAGTAAAAPKPPARTANDVVLAAVYVPANDTTISSAQIVDMRMLRERGPICIYKTTVAETTNTTAAAIHALDKTNSGIVIPNGLLLSGRQLRVNLRGHFLCNSGTPTLRLAIAFGGTTLFDDITSATTADTDRLVWSVDFILTAQGNADQSLNGVTVINVLAAKTAPTTGRGDIVSNANLVGGINGDSAVDCDAGNRTLTVTWTMSVSNAANELTVETATVEII